VQYLGAGAWGKVQEGTTTASVLSGKKYSNMQFRAKMAGRHYTTPLRSSMSMLM